MLVRHGTTAVTGKRLSGWLPGHHLSDEGRRQAESAAERLAPLAVKAVYSSPLERCWETAAVIAGRHRREPTTLEELGEIRYGDWQGRSFKALYRTKGWVELMNRPADFRFPGGETIREAQTRGMRAIEALRARHRKDLIVAVSHADMIRLILAGYLGLGLDLYQRMSVAPASVSALLLGDRIPRVLRMGDSGSLEDLAMRLTAGPTDQKAGPRRSPPGPASRVGPTKRATPAGKEAES